MTSPDRTLWEGSTRASDADRYLEYLTDRPGDYERAPETRACSPPSDSGERLTSCSQLLGVRGGDRGFAGDPIERARFYPEDDAFLVRREETVRHLELVHPRAPAR
jgi:hypothetical protein